MYNYTISPKVIMHLMRMEGIKEKRGPYSSFSSDFINNIDTTQFALHQVRSWAKENMPIAEHMIHRLYAFGKSSPEASEISFSYRTCQLVIRDSVTDSTLYIPPDPSDVPILMKTLINWIHKNKDLPIPLIAAIAQYQFHIISPFEDKNAEMGCLLSTLILYLGGYELNGFYSLTQIYNKNPRVYEEALHKNRPHNYYLGNLKPDITSWIDFFVESTTALFEAVILPHGNGLIKSLDIKRTLDPKQRRVLTLFKKYEALTALQIGSLFDLQPRTRAILCKIWTEKGFLEIVNSSNKGRTYKLARLYENLIEGQH